MEHVLVALDGSPVEVESAAIPITWQGLPAIEAIARDIRERKRAEERLREYEKAVEGVEEMIVVVDREYRYVLANRAFLNYRRMEREQVVGRSAPEVLNKGVFETVVKKKLDECFQGNVVTYEMKYKYPKLGERDLSLSYFPIEGPNGVERAACVIQDITERKRAETALVRLAAIVESSDDAIISKNLNGVITSWNAGAQRMFGYTEAEVLGQSITTIIPPELRDEEAGILQRLRAGEHIQHYETIRVTKHGKKVDVSLTISPMRDSEGRVVGASKIARDITERKQAEEALQRSEAEAKGRAEELAVILDAVPGMTLITRDPAGRTITGSRVAYELLRLPYGANISKSAPQGERPSTFRVVRDGQDLPASELPVQKAAATGQEVRESELTLLFDDGTSRDVFGNAAPLRDREGKVRGAVGVFVDITEHKRAEQALQESQGALARVARIVAMGELTASIAHEINQPLAAVATNASASLHWLAAQPPNLDEARKAVTSTIQEANRASDVIARVRALLRKASPQMAPLDVNEVIREVLALVRSELIRGGVTAKTKLAAGLPAVLGDRVQLQQVILNLIMNAIDAMTTITDRPRTLLIKSAKDAEGVLIQVQDSGKGLDPEHSDRIFESFFSTKPQGIGIGLSISSSIVEARGGRLWATPGSAQGAVFQLILPHAESPA